ncbi:unnamed protein product [Auanema sp. JU1783]|nr:unnamed protein product [Auanema sp. JU1783]
MKFEPLSLLINLGTPLLAIKRWNAFKNASADVLFTISKCIARDAIHVNKHTWTFSSFWRVNGPSRSHPQFSNGFLSTTLSDGKSGILGEPYGNPWNLLHLVHSLSIPLIVEIGFCM